MAPDERDRQEETREEAAAPGGQAPAGDAPEELRYEGPITIDEDEDDEYLDEGSGSGKFFLTAAVLSALVLVIIATAMWMRSGTGDRARAQEFAAMEPPPPVTEQAAAGNTAPAPGEVDYRALPDAPAAGAATTEPPALPPVEEPPVQRAEAPAGQQPSTAPAVPPVPRPRPREARNVEAATPSTGGAEASPARIRRLVLAGRIDEAARAGRSWASGRPRDEWTFQVLLACQPGTVERAYRKVIDPGLVLLPARLADGRSCYRVCWGTFPSREAAAASLRDVPAYFRRETKPLPRTWGDVLR